MEDRAIYSVSWPFELKTENHVYRFFRVSNNYYSDHVSLKSISLPDVLTQDVAISVITYWTHLSIIL